MIHWGQIGSGADAPNQKPKVLLDMVRDETDVCSLVLPHKERIYTSGNTTGNTSGNLVGTTSGNTTGKPSGNTTGNTNKNKNEKEASQEFFQALKINEENDGGIFQIPEFDAKTVAEIWHQKVIRDLNENKNGNKNLKTNSEIKNFHQKMEEKISSKSKNSIYDFVI